MNRNPVVFFALLVLAFAASPDAAFAEPEEILLYQAVAMREVSVNVLETKGHAKVLLQIVNRKPSRRRVRLPGTYLKPRGGRYQRLALGYNERAKTPTVSVPGVGHWKGWVTCCCMDHGKPSPAARTPYQVTRRKAPKKISIVMEHWSKHPTLPQKLVNQYVWGHKNGDMPTAPETPAAPQDFELDGVRLYAWGGRLLALCMSGDLLRLRDDGKWERLGESIEVVGVGWGRILARFGDEAIQEYNETEKIWVPRGTLPGAKVLLPGPKETYALMGKALFRRHEKGAWVRARHGVAGASLSKDLDGSYVFAVGTPQAGSGIKRSSGKAKSWTVSRRRGFRDVFATANAVYGLDRRGLVRITKEGYRRIRGTGSFYPFRKGILRIDREGNFEEYKDLEGVWHRHGRPGGIHAVAVDAVDGVVFALKGDGRVVTLDAKRQWKDLTTIPTERSALAGAEVEKTPEKAEAK
ncbi:MAG: hypothetical protein ACYS47_21510 [Planctomycetota bacterium]